MSFIAVAVGVSAATGIAGAAIGAHAAGKAADTQANAANQAAQIQHQDAQDSLAFQKQQYADQQKNTQPWIDAGQGAITHIAGDLNSGKYGDFTEKFTAPTAATEQNDPGYQFRLDQGMKALQRSAAARGGLLTGGTAKAAQQYGQDYASNEYQNVYNRQFGEYQNRFNIFNTNQTNDFNRWAAVAGAGQQANTTQGQIGQQAAANISNINLTSGQQIGNDLNNAAAARASGYAASANAWGQGLSGLGSLAWLYATRPKT